MHHCSFTRSAVGVSFAPVFVLALAASACGGGAQATPPAEPIAADSAGAPPPAASSAAAEAAAPAASDDAPATEAAKSDAKPLPDPNAQRDITYVVVPEGLKITVAGVKFVASSVAQQTGAGWGVKVNVDATADDDQTHSLTKPKAGPLAFAGSITRKGKSEHFGDERAGEGEAAVAGEKPLKISRIWPVKGVRALAIGDALDLQVGLWGLGTDADSRRPVKQFFHVRMQVDKGKPKAIVEPPASASGK
jgi:hypothetical protein